MKSKIILTFVFVAAFSNYTFSQSQTVERISIRGRITDLDNKPLAFVSIGVLNKSFGTLTDTLGNFIFQLPNQNLTDTLQISLVGYFSQKIAIKDFTETTDKTIHLSMKTTELAEVEATGKKMNVKTLGRKGSGKFIQVSIHNKKTVDETIGSEMGMKYNISRANAILKDLNFYLSANNFNAIKFRVNIYSVKDDMPDTLIYGKQIFAMVENYKTGWIKLDLEEYNIKVKGEFIVALQWVESKMNKKENPITMVPVALTPFSKNCYTRIASQDKWNKMGMSLSNFITIVY